MFKVAKKLRYAQINSGHLILMSRTYVPNLCPEEHYDCLSNII